MPRDDSGLFIPHPAAQRGRKVPVGAATSPSLGALRRQHGLTYRRLAALTGFTAGHLHDLVVGKGTAADRRRVQQMLRSSEPAFLSAIQRIAVPFLRSRCHPERSEGPRP